MPNCIHRAKDSSIRVQLLLQLFWCFGFLFNAFESSVWCVELYSQSVAQLEYNLIETVDSPLL